MHTHRRSYTDVHVHLKLTMDVHPSGYALKTHCIRTRHSLQDVPSHRSCLEMRHLSSKLYQNHGHTHACTHTHTHTHTHRRTHTDVHLHAHQKLTMDVHQSGYAQHIVLELLQLMHTNIPICPQVMQLLL